MSQLVFSEYSDGDQKVPSRIKDEGSGVAIATST
jgi:hypothetical protein